MLNSVDYIGIRRARLTSSRVGVFLGSYTVSFLDLPLQHPLGRRTSSFNLFTLVRYGELAATIRTRRGTLDLELGGCDASSMQEQISPRFSLSATLQARRAARGLPRDAAPRPMPSHLTPSPFSPLPPFLYSLPCPGRGCGWVWVGREGGRRSPSSSSTCLPLRAHLTLARRSLDARSTSSRRHCGRGDDG